MASPKAEKSETGPLLSFPPILPQSSLSELCPPERDENSSRILYDVWVHRQGSHLEQKNADEKTPTLHPASPSSSSALWSTVAGLVGHGSSGLEAHEMVDSLKKLESTQPQSHLALSNDGELVALIHQSSLMVLSHKDEYASISWKHTLGGTETAPQRYHLSWNPGDNLLAVVSSDRKLMIFTRYGRVVHTQEMRLPHGKEVEGVVEVGWSRDTAIGTRASQLFVLTYSGVLFRYLVYHHESLDMLILPLSQALEIKDDPKLGPLSNLTTILDHHSILTCMDISTDGRYLAVGGYGRLLQSNVGDPNDEFKAIHSPSVSFWRILGVPPFFEYLAPINLVNAHPHHQPKNKSSKRCCGRRSGSKQNSRKNKSTPLVLLRSVQFSHDSQHLMTLDTAGSVTIWDIQKQLPIRRYRSENLWKLAGGSTLVPAPTSAQSLVLTVHWWNSDALFIMHASGVCSVLGPVVGSNPLTTPRFNALNLTGLSSTLLTPATSINSTDSSIPSSSAQSDTPAKPLLSNDSSEAKKDKLSLLTAHSSSSGNLLASHNLVSGVLGVASHARNRGEEVALHNLLGTSSELFAPNSTASRIRGQRVFIFETVSVQVQVPRKRPLYSGSNSQTRKDIDPDLEVPYEYEMEGAVQPSRLKKAALSTWRWFVGHTDDKLADSTIMKRRVTNRLLSLRKTTPMELFFSKVSAGDYSFALSLASHYRLNPDMVYQIQWRLRPVTKESIAELLEKISDKSWVIHECIERVPLTLESASILLEYGIKHAVPSWIEPGSGDRPLSEQELKITKSKLEAYAAGSFDAPARKDIKVILQRLILLSHRDRLQTYAKINDRNSHFDAREYLNFRTCSLVNACATFAQNEDIRAMEVLWTYHGEETLPYRLILLSYLPETLSADSASVRMIYPAVQQRNDETLPDTPIEAWETQKLRTVEDWAETPEIRRWLGLVTPIIPTSGHRLESLLSQYAIVLREEKSQQNDPVKREQARLVDESVCNDIFSLPTESPEPLNLGKPISADFSEPIYRELTSKDLTKWYKMRAVEIENLSGQADKALVLIQLGIQNRVPRLEKIHEKLRLLCSLVYDCGKSTHLAEFEHMDNLRRLHFLLEDATPSTIVSILNERCEVYIHNAHQVWRQFEAEGTPSFTSAFLAQWMSDIARATSNHSTNALSYGMLPHLVQIFKSSAKSLNKPKGVSAVPSSSSISQATSSAQLDVLDHEDIPIIPTEYMLAVLGLHVCYLCSPSSQAILDQLHAIHKVLPHRPIAKPAIQPAKPSEDASKPDEPTLHIVGSELSVSSVDVDFEMESLYDRVELLGKHLQAAEILFRYDIVKPLDMFFSTWRADDPAAIRQLLERLVQPDVRANPPLPNARWRSTLKYMQELREVLNASLPLLSAATAAIAQGSSSTSSSVKSSIDLQRSASSSGVVSPLVRTPTKKISPSASALLASPSNVTATLLSHSAANTAPGLSVDLPYEVFCQSLLRSGNFALAKHYLYDLPNYDSLVISVAQFYFNSCSSAKDKDMQLAQECLALIRNPNQQTAEEQKLIDAVVQMSKLEDKFHLQMSPILPIQVRQSNDRMSYLRQLLEPPTAHSKSNFDLSTTAPLKEKDEIYKNLDELLDLGRLLGCASSDSQRQEIKLLAANRAFKSKDYEVASKWCMELMASPSAASNGVWDLAYRLAMVEKVDIRLRTKLLAFSMRHAPQESLQSMVSLWRALELRASCSSIGLNVDMPRGIPAHLHLNEKSSSHPSQSAPVLSSLRLDARKVMNTQSTFVNTCMGKIEEMNATQWLTKMESEMVSEDASQLHLYSFYHPAPYRSPYSTSDIQLRVDPGSGPLATFGEKSIEHAILTKIKALSLSSASLAGSPKLEVLLSQMAQISATNGDMSLVITCLLDPAVSPSTARNFFDTLLTRVSGAATSTVVQMAKYYFGILILQLYFSIKRSPSEVEAAELTGLSAATLLEYSPALLIKRTEKFVSRPSAGNALEDESFSVPMEMLVLNFNHFAELAIPESHSSIPQLKLKKAENGHSKSYVLSLARNTTPEGLDRALQMLEMEGSDADEFTVLETHFIALIESEQVPMKSINAFLNMYGDALTHQHTLRFERALDEIWNILTSSVPAQRLHLILKLQLSCAKFHASALKSSALKPTTIAEKYGTPEFVSLVTKRAELLETLAKSLLSSMPSTAAGDNPSKALQVDWKALLSGELSAVLASLEASLNLDNVAIFARAAPQLSELCTMASGTAPDQIVIESPPISASLVYFILAETALKPFNLASSNRSDEKSATKVTEWFKRNFYSKLNAIHLHQFLARFLVEPDNLPISMRLSMCEDILEYLELLLGGEEDETVVLLKTLKTHFLALTTLQDEWAGFRASSSTTQKSHLSSYIQLLDRTFGSPHKDAEVANISSRLLINGFPLTMTINIVEVYNFEKAFDSNHSLLDIVNHVVLDALKIILEMITPLSELPKTENSQVVPGFLEWPPTEPEKAAVMLRAVLRSVATSGSSRFYKDPLERIREAARKIETSEPIRLFLLQSLIEHPTLYETRKDWLLQDERLVENNMIAQIMAEFEEPQENGASVVQGSLTHSPDGKLAAIKKLVAQNRYEPAFQLLWIWSSKLQKSLPVPSPEAKKSDAEDTGSKPQTTKQFQLDDSSGDGESGWGFEDAELDPKPSKPSSSDQKDELESDLSAEHSKEADTIKIDSFQFASGWNALFEKLLSERDYEKVLLMRGKVRANWLPSDMDTKMASQISKAASPLTSWKYCLCSDNQSLINECVDQIKDHIRHRPTETAPVTPSKQSGIRGFFRGIVASIQPVNVAPMRYGSDYDAQLLYFVLKYGSFVDFMAEDAFRPLIIEMALFLLKTKPIEPSRPGYSEYLQQEEAHSSDLQIYDAAITYPGIVSALFGSEDMDEEIANFVFEFRQVSRPMRTPQHFKSIISEVMRAFIDEAKNKSSEEQNRSSNTPNRVGLSWKTCLDRCNKMRQKL